MNYRIEIYSKKKKENWFTQTMSKYVANVGRNFISLFRSHLS